MNIKYSSRKEITVSGETSVWGGEWHYQYHVMNIYSIDQ